MIEYGLLASKSSDFLRQIFDIIDMIPFGRGIVVIIVVALLVYFFFFRGR